MNGCRVYWNAFWKSILCWVASVFAVIVITGIMNPLTDVTGLLGIITILSYPAWALWFIKQEKEHYNLPFADTPDRIEGDAKPKRKDQAQKPEQTKQRRKQSGNGCLIFGLALTACVLIVLLVNSMNLSNNGGITSRRNASNAAYAQRGANVRSCPETSCAILTSLTRGEQVTIKSTVEGENVYNDTAWFELSLGDDVGYVHRSLIASSPPPTYAPVMTQAAPRQYSCDCERTCEQVVSCREAYFQLNDCGCARRDRDGDGVPCDNICR